MGEISEALGRARKENKGSQRATREARPPVLQESEGEGRDSTFSDLRRELLPETNREESLGRSSSQDRFDSSQASSAGDLARSREMSEEASRENTGSPPSANFHVISKARDEGWVGRICAVDPQGTEAIRFRHLAVRVRKLLDARSPRSVLVTSALPGEGKTTVSVNLALALSSIAQDYRVALVDMDLRRGRVAATLGYEPSIGLEAVLEGKAVLEDVRVTTEGEGTGLDFFPMSSPLTDAHRVLGGVAQDFLETLGRQYDYVVIDGPPVLPVPDVPLIAPYVGGCLAVVSAGRTRQAAFRELLELLPKASILGAFLNESGSASGGGRYGYYPSYADASVANEAVDS